MEFIQGLDMFKPIIDEYEIGRICDAFVREQFKEGDRILQEGEPGEDFYLIVSGEVYVTKTLKEGGTPERVMEMGKGRYFGELALIKNAPRAANVIALTDATVLRLNRRAFKRLLGPIKPFLERNMTVYSKQNPAIEKTLNYI